MVEIEIDVFDPQCTGQRRGDLEKLKYEITGKKEGWNRHRATANWQSKVENLETGLIPPMIIFKKNLAGHYQLTCNTVLGPTKGVNRSPSKQELNRGDLPSVGT